MADKKPAPIDKHDLVLSIWGYDDEFTRRLVEKPYLVNSMKHGILANVPMICRGNRCPYIKTCYLTEEERPEGKRCPIEVAEVISEFEKYVESLNVEPDNFVDISLVKELVDIEIQIRRAERKIAESGDFEEQVVAAVSQNGDVYYKPELKKAVEYKERLRKERHRILQLLNSTRKDKKTDNSQLDPSVMFAQIMAKMQAINTTATVKEDEEESDV